MVAFLKKLLKKKSGRTEKHGLEVRSYSVQVLEETGIQNILRTYKLWGLPRVGQREESLPGAESPLTCSYWRGANGC